MSDETTTSARGDRLHNLKPAPGSRKPRKRVGRGEGSGMGKTSGRGQKGAGSRSGAKDRARFEGGQMPIHMRMRKLRGPHMKKSMPFEPFRTHTQPVNLRDLEARFDAGAEVTLEALKAARASATRKDIPVKILAKGELTKPLTVHAHGSARPRATAIEAAGGTVVAASTRTALAARAADARRRSSAPSRSRRSARSSPSRRCMLALYRLGSHIPVPGINIEAVKAIQEQFGGGGILSLLNLFSRRRPDAGSRSSRSGSCPTSRRRSSCSC